MHMASSSKQRTTFAKLNREQKVREKRVEKEARKAARKREEAMAGTAPEETVASDLDLDIDLDKHPAVTGEQI